MILLLALAILSFATADFRAGSVVLLMVDFRAGLYGLFRVTRADTAAAKLKAMISVTATVVRDGQPAKSRSNTSCRAMS